MNAVRRILLFLALALAVSFGTAARAEYPARPDGPVLDAADIIPDGEEPALIERLNKYNQETGRALMVVTVPSLDGEDVATYANTLGHQWGVGGKETDQGLILLIAPTERKIRIEVGYGLEARLPDILAGQIVRQIISPRFKAGDYNGGITAGLDAIVAQLNRDPADTKAVAEAAAAAQRDRADDANPSAVVFWIMLIVFMMMLFGRRGRRGMRRSGIDPGIVLWGVSEVLHHANRSGGGGWSSSDWGGSSGGSDWGGFGGGDFGGGGASGDW